ncbi:hypothetical protein GW17_00025433 [Ensete ventricosum]|nr:hypothetical protein GW17_00025433 [Ensete ventricosum]
MKGPVVVTGASGYIGTWLVMKLLQKGYVLSLIHVGAREELTLLHAANQKKIKPLVDLPGSVEQLTIWRADLEEEGSFDEVVKGCEGVFHMATPMDFESKDPQVISRHFRIRTLDDKHMTRRWCTILQNEIIKPTVDGVLSIMRSCKEAGMVRRVVFTSSAGTVNMQEQQQPQYDESSWSDIDFCRRVKMTGWMHLVSKSLAEKAACEFARENGIELIIIIPTLVVGPFITTTMPPSMITALSLITG